MGQSVLVTGGTGFLGHHLCRALSARGDRVTFLMHDINSAEPFWAIQRALNSEMRAVFGPISIPDFIERVLNDQSIEVVFHLAAQTQVSLAASNPFEAFGTNVGGTLGVLEACRRRKTPRVIVAATDKVYGNGTIPYVEDNPLIERTPYGASKVCADVIAQTYQQTYGMGVAITRCGNLYGPGHMNFSTLIPGTIKKVYNNERPVVRFGGKATRDFLYIKDAVNAYLTLADSDKVGAFNFSRGMPQEILEIVRIIIQKMGGGVEPIIQPGGSGEIEKQWLSCARARKELGWEPEWSFEHGLDETIDWYKRYFDGGKHVAG